MSAPALFTLTVRPRAVARPVAVVCACAAAILILLALYSKPSHILIAIAAIVGPATLLYGVRYTYRHTEWLIFPLALIALLIQISLFSDNLRSAFHYGAVALFCLPAVSIVRRSSILRTGGFRLYVVYFAWAAITVMYSLAPVYSLARLMDAVLIMIGTAACILQIRKPEDVTQLLLRFLLAGGIMLVMLVVSTAVLPHSITWQSPFESYEPDELANMAKAGISVFGLDRFRGLTSGPNVLGALMLVVVGPALVCWHAVEKRGRRILVAMIATSLALDVLADSRSAFVAMACGSGLFVVWKWRLRGALVCAGALAAAVLVMLHRGMFDYVGRDVGTLTGRTDIWAFLIQKIREQPILGYGYEVAGAVFDSKYFPIWWGPWDMGPHSSLHNGYLGHAIGVGIPATAFWLYIILRPWVFALRQKEDPWNLKPMFFLIVVPILINNFSEQLLDDFGGGIVALLFGLVWAIAERYRILALRKKETDRKAAVTALPKAIGALASAG